jgi:hypothetical protein
MDCAQWIGDMAVTMIILQRRKPMANVKQGNLTKSPQWWKHLKDFKRFFWKAERKAQNNDIKGRLHE